MEMKNVLGDMLVCHNCKKQFIPICKSQYTYKYKDDSGTVQYCCSYSCYNKGKSKLKRKDKDKDYVSYILE